MLLDKIFAYIAEQKSATSDTRLQGVLDTIQHLLLESADGQRPEHLKQALLYIQRVPIKGGFLAADESMGEHLKGAGSLYVRDLDQSKTPVSPVLSQAARKILGVLHASIMLHYKQIKWSYSFPLDDTGQVMNDAIGEWQADRTILPRDTSENKAYRDFTRPGLTIGGVAIRPGENEGDITRRLDSLVSQSAYSADEKEKIKIWLKNNGGQDTNRFFDAMLLKGYYSEAERRMNLERNITLKQDWQVEKGKIYFNFDILARSFFFPGKLLTEESGEKASAEASHKKRSYIYVKDGNILGEDDPEEALAKIEYDPTKIPDFVMRLTAKIELEVDKNTGKVTPRIVSLDNVSYTRGLLSPERLYKAEKKEAPKPSAPTPSK